MEKNKLLLFPFFIGLILMIYSWYLSYPLSINSPDDFVFNHVSILYWFSLPLLLTSMLMIAITFKNDYLKWIMTVGIVMTLYSLSYFYYRLPTSDSLYYRGLNEYFIRTDNLDFSQPSKSYFQWPSIFVLSNIATSVSGLELANFEFLMYAIMGFIMATALYIYASKAHKQGGFLAAIIFFVAMFYYLNYQFAAFTIAFSFLLLLFMLSTQRRSTSIILTSMVFFASMTITHAYAPLFFIIFLLIQWIITRSKHYGEFFLLTSIIWLLFQITLANVAFVENIWTMMNAPTEITGVGLTRFVPVSVPIDAIAQNFSTAVLLISVIICVVGSIILLIKRRMRDLDKAILLTGAGYFGLGIILFLLGSRGIPIAFIPFALGASYLFESRFRPYLISLFLVLLIIFSFIPIHLTFMTDIQFQTKEAYSAENFFINYYNWEKFHFILANFRVITYFTTKLDVETNLSLDPHNVEEVDTIFYTVGLGRDFSAENYTMERLIKEERLNVIYDNSLSIVATRS